MSGALRFAAYAYPPNALGYCGPDASRQLLERVGPRLLGDSLESRFRVRAGRSWPRLVDAVPAGALPHHSFHVFGVYPWLGLLREGRVDEPLQVLDRCRIRWGLVLDVLDGQAIVRSRPLRWDGRRLLLAEPREERVLQHLDGLGLAGTIRPGDWCSLHWDWVCERLDRRQLTALRHHTLSQLKVANGTPFPAPASILA